MYEALFEELEEKMSGHGRKISAIWIADVAHQGQSGILNEEALGNDRLYMTGTKTMSFEADHVSKLVGFHARPPVPHQPETERDAATSCGHRP